LAELNPRDGKKYMEMMAYIPKSNKKSHGKQA